MSFPMSMACSSRLTRTRMVSSTSLSHLTRFKGVGLKVEGLGFTGLRVQGFTGSGV